MSKNAPIRHGEIMLVPLDEAPATAKFKARKTFIVGHSETGHHHVLEGQFDVAILDDELYFRLFEPAKLVHKKTHDRHRDLVVDPGIYKRFHDTEYDPFSRIIREVAD